MKRRDYLITIVLMLLFLLIMGCGPKYATTYDFLPLQAESQRSCATNCLMLKQSCMSSAQSSYQSCLMNSNTSFSLCQASRVFGTDRNGNYRCLFNCFCARQSCDLQDEPCETTHRQCYVGCGGRIKATTQCVSSCEEASAPTTRMIQ